MKTFLAEFIADEAGATAIEYSLLAALIGVAIIAAADTLGKSIGNTFNNVTNGIS